MKRFILLFISLILVESLWGQKWTDHKELVGVGLGIGGSNILVHSSHLYNNIYPRASFNIEYLRRFSESFCVGGSFAYNIQTADTITYLLENLDVRAVDNSLSLALLARYYYYQGNKFSFYSQLGIGLKEYNVRYTGPDVSELDSRRESGVMPTFQYYIAGIEYGNSKWKFFYQLGFSGEGINKVGFIYGL